MELIKKSAKEMSHILSNCDNFNHKGRVYRGLSGLNDDGTFTARMAPRGGAMAGEVIVFKVSPPAAV